MISSFKAQQRVVDSGWMWHRACGGAVVPIAVWIVFADGIHQLVCKWNACLIDSID